MDRIIDLEFTRSGSNGGELVLERIFMPTALFDRRSDFEEWARKSLPARRGNRRKPLWPDAVRAVSADGVELYRWTLADQFAAGCPLVA